MNRTINKVVLSMVKIASLASAICSVVSARDFTKKHVLWNDVEVMCKAVHEEAVKDTFNPDLIIGLSRGGLIPLGLLAGEKMFDQRNTLSIAVSSYDRTKQGNITLLLPVHTENLRDYKSVLVVDDLIDSGKTMAFVVALLKKDLPEATIKTAVLFYKPANTTMTPDYYASETADWIVFPWETE